MALQAHLIGETYGMTPTEVLDRPAKDFWMDAQIRAAGVDWQNEQKKKARQDGSAGVATEAEKEDLVAANEARADRREQGGQPSPAEQLAAFEGDG